MLCLFLLVFPGLNRHQSKSFHQTCDSGPWQLRRCGKNRGSNMPYYSQRKKWNNINMDCANSICDDSKCHVSQSDDSVNWHLPQYSQLSDLHGWSFSRQGLNTGRCPHRVVCVLLRTSHANCEVVPRPWRCTFWITKVLQRHFEMFIMPRSTRNKLPAVFFCCGQMLLVIDFRNLQDAEFEKTKIAWRTVSTLAFLPIGLQWKRGGTIGRVHQRRKAGAFGSRVPYFT